MTAPTIPDRRRSRVATAAALAGWVALAAIVAGAVLAALPLRNGGVQDCGAPAAFLLAGRPDVYPDAAGKVHRPDGSTFKLGKADLDRAYSSRCGERVARRMVPAGMLIAGGMALGLLAATVAIAGTWRRRPPRPDRVDAAGEPFPARPAGG